jgi:nucleoside-diphosphate-sugar epimerase
MSSSVVVVGAAGYIGQAVALAYRRAGFKVTGVVRNEEKAKVLKQHEVNVVVGDLKTPDSFKDVLKTAVVVVDAVGDDEGKLLEKLVEVTKGRSPKPLYIFTSGVLVYGDHQHVVDETHPLESTHLAQRAAFSNKVLSSSDVRGVVILPGFVYGGASGVLGDLIFNIKENDDLTLIGRREKRWSYVHIEDLADIYVRVAKAGHIVDGESFNAVGPWAPTFEEIKVAAAKAAGWKGKINHVPEVPKDNFFAVICEYNAVASGAKAFNLLGWHETHLGPVAEIGTYYQSYKANKGK